MRIEPCASLPYGQFPFQLEKRLSGIAPSGAATRGPWLPISAVKIAPERPKEPTMKVLMVLTSHDQLGDTGRKTGFWLEECIQRRAGADHASVAQGGPPAARPQEPGSELPDRHYPSLREGRRCRGPARQDGAPREREAGGLRYGLLSGRTRPDVGPGRRSELGHADRVLPRRRQARGAGLPCAWRAAPRQGSLRQAAGRRQEGDRLHQRRGGGRRPDQGRAFPRRGRATSPWRHLFQGQELGCPHGQARPPDHWPEPRIVRSGRQGPDRHSEGFVVFDCLVLRATTATPRSHQAKEGSYEIVQRRYWLDPHPDRDGRDRAASFGGSTESQDRGPCPRCVC